MSDADLLMEQYTALEADCEAGRRKIEGERLTLAFAGPLPARKPRRGRVESTPMFGAGEEQLGLFEGPSPGMGGRI